MLREPVRNPEAGLTLAELLIGAAISALLVTGLAQSLGAFSAHVEQVRAESDGGPDEALALMLDMSRHGWDVSQPAASDLHVSDADGETTVFSLQDGVLSVTRPSGVSGALLDGVADVSIDTEVVRRLREDEPLDAYRAWWQRDLPAELLDSSTIESGLPMALGFTMDSDVPDEFDVLVDVDEHARHGLLETLVLPLSYLAGVPADPNAPVVGEDSGPGVGGGQKVEICHVPPGNPENAHTLKVSENAVQAHLDHGDWLGPCEAAPDDDPSAVLYVQLFEARAHDDARPHGEALGALSIPATALPSGSAAWVATSTGEHGGSHDHGADECAATTPDGKVVICHVPPGNPANAHPITISPNAVPAHLAHGDYYGVCGQHEDADEVWVLEIDAPPTDVALDLSPLGALIQPGRAYTLVFELQGQGFVYVASAALPSSEHSGVAQAAEADGELHGAPVAVPFELRGTQTITQTEEHHPISSVSVAIEMDDGRSAQGSASVVGQVAVPGAWAGVVPGETGGAQ